jgi:hypothetical protein
MSGWGRRKRRFTETEYSENDSPEIRRDRANDEYRAFVTMLAVGLVLVLLGILCTALKMIIGGQVDAFGMRVSGPIGILLIGLGAFVIVRAQFKLRIKK